MRILFLSSGGEDSKAALKKILKDNPGADVQSLTLEVADTETLASAQALAEEYGIPHFVLPFENTRKYITRRPPGREWAGDTATTFWSFEIHFKGIQYASAHGFDYVASGHDGTPVNGEIEELLQKVQDLHLFANKVGVLRPMRNVKNEEDRKAFVAALGDD